MLSFSETNTIDALIEKVNALPEQTPEVNAEFAREVKSLAVLMLNATRSERINGAHFHLVANFMASLNARQVELQVTGTHIKDGGKLQ